MARKLYIASPVVLVLLLAYVQGLALWPHNFAYLGFLVGVALAAVTVGNRRYSVFVPWLLVISAGGVYLTTPDTERASLFAAAMVVMAVVSFAVPGAWHADLAAPALVCLAWVAATDGAPRSSAVVGALGCAAAVPLLRWTDVRPRLVVGAHVVAVLVAARIAGRQSDLIPSVMIVAADWAVLAVVIIRRPQQTD